MIGLKRIFIILLLLNSVQLSAQDGTGFQVADYTKIIDAQVEPLHKHRYDFHLADPSNELKFILTGLYIIYKQFVSSQDSRSCVFRPSCSTYALETINKNGILVGFLDSIDRLTRCHPFSMENYKIDEEHQLLIDNP